MAAKSTIDTLGVKVVGLHIHAGSGILEGDNWISNANLMASLRANFPHLKFLNVGGGLGVPYRLHESPLDLKEVAQSLTQFKQNVLASHDLELWMEPGRYFVAEAGVILAKVTQLKEKPGKRFVGVNTGMNSLIRPALYEAYHHIVNISRMEEHQEDSTLIFDVVGPICETGDVLGNASSISVRLFFFSMKTNHFVLLLPNFAFVSKDMIAICLATRTKETGFSSLMLVLTASA